MKDNKEIVNRIEHIQFGYYSSEEIRRLSVKEIKNPIAFDQLQRPLANGLYDPSLGISPYDRWSRCVTCGQDGLNCQGHHGHIELLLGVYNPFLLVQLIKLLKSMCLACGHLRIAKDKVKQYVHMLLLIKLGYLGAAAIYDYCVNNRLYKGQETKEHLSTTNCDTDTNHSHNHTTTNTSHKKYNKKQIETFIKNIIQECIDNKEEAEQLMQVKEHPDDFQTPCEDTQQIQRALKEKIQELYSSVNVMTCPHCNTRSHAIKKEGFSKLFIINKPHKKNNIQGNNIQGDNIQGDNNNIQGDNTNNNNNSKENKQMYLNPLEVREHLKRLWKKEKRILDLLFGSVMANKHTIEHSDQGYTLMSNNLNMFFIEVLQVTPNRFRPENKMDDQVFMHSHTVMYTKIININQDLRKLLLKEDSGMENLQVKNQLKSQVSLQSVIQKWLELQDSVNTLYDASKALKASERETTGIRQLFEKKEGLFRMKMMGKRVNFAARSVISPDPYLDTNEVGVPLFVAKRLTFPEGVQEHNVDRLRQMVINGPYVWPGANSVEENGVRTSLEARSLQERQGIAKLLLQNNSQKTVLRHLCSGDVMMFNRQPTLHKPSLMSHIARVLPKENTIRMHYANCSSYNADFDGDEMNLHFLQNHLARSEAYHLSLNDHQYILAKNGSPIRGLIQDSVLSGAMVTSKDTFLPQWLFQQLIYISTWQCLTTKHTIHMPKPALFKPQRLFTGKQLITTILKTLVDCELNQHSDQRKGLYMDKGTKVPADIFGEGAKDEAMLYVQDNEVIHGIIDKNQIGATDFGLVHSFYELYGAKMTGKLLTSLARLFSAYLQYNGFSAGMEDLFLSKKDDQQRKQLILKAHQIGTKAAASFAGDYDFQTPSTWKLFNRPTFDGQDDKVHNRKQGVDYLHNQHPLLNKIENKIVMQSTGSAELDMEIKSQLNVITTDIFKLTNYGLRRQYPENLFSTMVLTGAKGSNVNHNQISVMLGQQELEGRRVPITITGKSLPCFLAYDPNPRAGGYIADRFLTGLRPQEFFFHCMAGREGLIDTAVKTSRSGYLQRCLVKHLEGLKVAYDYTVRDSDDSILQFNYGEDSIDSTKNKFLTKFHFITNNYNGFVNKYNPKSLSKVLDTTTVKGFLKARRQNPHNYRHQTILNQYQPGSYLGAISELGYQKIQDFIQSEKDKQSQDIPSIFDDKKISDKKLFSLFNIKYFHSLIQPGECVGPIAAQSVGEPSTQMTLNTFHLAGHGGANVTLGIPRLREILMTAAKVIKTPTMTLPFLDEEVRKSKEKAEEYSKKLQNINLRELVEKIEVREQTIIVGERYRRYRIKVSFEDLTAIESVFGLDSKDLAKVMEKKFILNLLTIIHKEVKKDASKNGQARVIKVSEDKEKEVEEEVEEEQEDQEQEEEEEDKPKDKQDKQLKGDKKEKQKEKGDKNYEHISKQMLQYFHGMKFRKGTFNTQVKLPLNQKKLLMLQIVEQALQQTVMNEIPGITRCIMCKDKNKGYTLQTEGVNFPRMWAIPFINQNKVESNDVHQIITYYGIEAGRQSIINEINRVFGVYHIQVDFRHLSLIADYMTYLGTVRGLNRMGISDHPSSFLKMSFETTIKFLQDSTIQREVEYGKSPSSQIILGRVPKVGTGMFDIRYKFK